MYLYDTVKDAYSTVFSFQGKDSYKWLSKDGKGNIFLVNNSDRTIYRSNMNDIQNWVSVGQFQLNLDNLESEPLFYEGCVYFAYYCNKIARLNTCDNTLVSITFNSINE